MWVLKLVFEYNEGTIFGSYCKKHNVILNGYPNSYEIINNEVKCLISGKIIGKAKNILQFLKDIKKDKKCLNLEYKNNFLIIQVLQDINSKYFFGPDILYIKPAITNENGEYIFEIATWNREKINEILKIYDKYEVKSKVEFIKKTDIKSIFFTNIEPNLTEKQKFCFSLAQKKGYYEFPRKTTLTKLAKLANLSYTTFQFHLRNAEKKLFQKIEL